MATEQFTELETPPEYRGGDTRPYVRELSRWVLRYHLMLQPILAASLQLRADIAALGELTQTIDVAPTQGQVLAIQNKVNAIVAAAATQES